MVVNIDREISIQIMDSRDLFLVLDVKGSSVFDYVIFLTGH